MSTLRANRRREDAAFLRRGFIHLPGLRSDDAGMKPPLSNLTPLPTQPHAECGILNQPVETGGHAADIVRFHKKAGFPVEHQVRDVLQQLPMEFMAETQKLIGISLEGSVG